MGNLQMVEILDKIFLPVLIFISFSLASELASGLMDLADSWKRLLHTTSAWKQRLFTVHYQSPMSLFLQNVCCTGLHVTL